MAEDLEVWGERTPQRRPLYGHKQPPTFGAAREAEQMRDGGLPGALPHLRNGSSANGNGSAGGRRDRAWDNVLQPFANRERRPVDVWHGVMCRLGRHDMRGGHQVQLGSRMVLVERRCHWCGSKGGVS